MDRLSQPRRLSGVVLLTSRPYLRSIIWSWRCTTHKLYSFLLISQVIKKLRDASLVELPTNRNVLRGYHSSWWTNGPAKHCRENFPWHGLIGPSDVRIVVSNMFQVRPDDGCSDACYHSCVDFEVAEDCAGSCYIKYKLPLHITASYCQSGLDNDLADKGSVHVYKPRCSRRKMLSKASWEIVGTCWFIIW